MAGHSNPGSTDAVIIRTGSSPVVADTSLSQPDSTYDVVSTCVAVMSASSKRPNIFPILVMGTNLLCLLHDLDETMHPSKKFDHCRLRNAPVLTPQPFAVFEYFERYQTCFKVGPFRQLWTDRNECRTVSGRVMIRLSLDGPNAVTTG